MKEVDIRPLELMKRYVELSAKDADLCFTGGQRRDLPCVSCGSENIKKEFSKSGFEYASCNDCGTLYQTPRPPIKEFDAFYKNSRSSQYWADVFFPSVAEARREKIFKPRVKRLLKLCKTTNLNVSKLIDVGAGYGIFLDEWRKAVPETELVAIEPSVSLAEECRNKKLSVVESLVENVEGYEGYADLVVCFEVLEHVDSPLEFIKVLKKMVKPEGYLFISTLCIDGFDLQVLWDKSSQISPPHHINFHSIKGFEKLYERAGLTDVRISTPGKLDVDIVKNFVTSSDGSVLQNNRFLKSILDSDNKSDKFQDFLSSNQLSSHVWIMAKKPNKGN
jgi:2-polyprenyl-3-methyl-5-hydroxy-6-metoxy-1,4-benzoquinol methylase